MMPSINLTHAFEKIAPSGDVEEELTAICSELIGKYTWFQVEKKTLFFKITNIVEIRKVSEIDWSECAQKESRLCGTIHYKEHILPVFDFRRKADLKSDDIIKSDRVMILNVDHRENNLLIGFLFNEIDEIVF
jgi:chemotaxis signal transduction protein